MNKLEGFFLKYLILPAVTLNHFQRKQNQEFGTNC